MVISKPDDPKAQAFCSSTALQLANSRISGWSTFKTTVFAARRVLPPDLMAPAVASAPRIKETGPEASPPPARCSREERMVERLIPEPGPPLKILPSVLIPSRIEGIVSSPERMKKAGH